MCNTAALSLSLLLYTLSVQRLKLFTANEYIAAETKSYTLHIRDHNCVASCNRINCSVWMSVYKYIYIRKIRGHNLFFFVVKVAIPSKKMGIHLFNLTESLTTFVGIHTIRTWCIMLVMCGKTKPMTLCVLLICEMPL